MPNLQLTAEQDAFMVSPTSANFTASITGESGTGALACVVSPSFTTPILGTPTSGTLTNCTIPVGQITGTGTGVLTFLATPSGANLATALTTALPASKGGTGLTALGTGVATFLGTPSSANLLAAVTDETGSGALVFGTSPSITTSIVSASTTLAVFNTVATTVNAFGVATALNIGAGAATILNFGGFTSAAELRFMEPSGSGTNYSGFKQPTLGTSITYLLPSDAPTDGQFLSCLANGTLSWETSAGSGDVSGPVSSTDNAIAVWNGTGGDTLEDSSITITGGNTLNATNVAATNATVTTFLPVSNDGAAIGTSGTAFSDLFLASGAVINFNAGNLTLTHSAGILTSNGAYAGTTGTFTATTSLLIGTAGSAVGNIGFRNATSGTATLAPPTGALGTYTVTLPNAASTLPIFGQQITFAGPTATRTVTLPDENFSVGFRNIPQNAKTGSYTLLATDNGRVIPNTTGGWTVNNSVHTAGDVVLVYNDSASSQNITAGTITTMRLAGTTTTGTRALAARGLATLYFQTATEVVVSGAGVT